MTDMARYLITELNSGITPDGERVVSARNLAATWQPQVAMSDKTSYGLGWVVDEYKGLPVLHHGGNTSGFTSDLAFFPTADLGITLLTNQQGCAVNQMIRYRLLEMLYEQPYEVDSAVQWQMDMLRDAIADLLESLEPAVDEESIRPCLGTYHNDALGEVTIQWDEGRLLFDAGEFQAEARSMVENGEVSYGLYDSILAGLPVAFRESGEGAPIMAIGTGVNEYAFVRVE